MKQKIVRALLKSSCTGIAAICFGANGLWATTHVVQFGGNLGFMYSPSSFTAKVGDTVKWEGDFSIHPLSSTSVPSTALAWHNAAGTSFIYAIKVAGTYDYHCDVHFSIGMTGSFTATGSAVRSNGLPAGARRVEDMQLGVSEISGMPPKVNFTVSSERKVTVKVFDLSGREQATVLDRVVLAGSYSIPLGALTAASGYYFVKLSSSGVERVVSFFISN